MLEQRAEECSLSSDVQNPAETIPEFEPAETGSTEKKTLFPTFVKTIEIRREKIHKVQKWAGDIGMHH